MAWWLKYDLIHEVYFWTIDYWLIDWLIDSHIDSDSTYIDVWLANKQSYMCVQATIVRTQENFARLFVAESFGYVVA